MNEYTKKGHPVLGVILGILGIVAALLLFFFVGVVGGIIAGLLGLAAVLIGLSARKHGKGTAAVVTGILAIILAVFLTLQSVSFYTGIRDKAEKYAEEAPLVVKYLDNPYLGLMGIIMNLPQDEGTAQELVDQLNLIREKNETPAQ